MENCCSDRYCRQCARCYHCEQFQQCRFQFQSGKGHSFNLFAQPNGGRLLAVLLVGIGLWAILQLIVGGAVQLGYAHFNLNLVDGNDAAISDLFSQKDRLWDGFCMKFLQGLYIALWSLLLVIPGIVKHTAMR